MGFRVYKGIRVYGLAKCLDLSRFFESELPGSSRKRYIDVVRTWGLL